MDIKAYLDPEIPLENIRTFKTVQLKMTAESPVLEKELLYMLKEMLQEKGLEYVEEDPDAYVGVIGFIGPFQEYVPPSTFYWPVPKKSSTNVSGFIGTRWISGSIKQTQTDYVPITKQGYAVTKYYRNIQVVFSQMTEVADSLQADLIWHGTVESSGYTKDLLRAAPILLDELMQEFPKRTMKPTRRERSIY
jgi:hypothetical protein